GEYGAGPGQFIGIKSLNFGPDNNLYVSSTTKVQVFNKSGDLIHHWDLTDDLSVIGGVALSPDGQVIVADSYGGGYYIYNQGFSKILTGLPCNTEDHFRAYATNAQGTGYGEDRTSTTPVCDTSGLFIMKVKTDHPGTSNN